MTNVLIILLFSLIYFFLDAWHDHYLILWHRYAGDTAKSKIYSRYWHAVDALIKGGVGAMVVYLMFGFSLDALWYLFLFLIIRWIWFDAALNILNGKPITYVGNTALLDRIFRLKGLQFFVKGVILIVVLILLITHT